MDENVIDLQESPLEPILIDADRLNRECKYEHSVDLLDEHDEEFALADDDVRIRYLLMKAKSLYLISKWDESEHTLTQVKTLIADDPEHKDHTVKMLVNKGQILWRQGKYYEAEELLRQAMKLGMEDEALLGETFVAIANVKSDRGQMDEATECYHKAIDILEPLGVSIDLVSAYNNLSDAYLRMEKYDLSLEYANKCSAASHEHGIKRQEGFGYMTASEACLAMDDTVKARDYLQKSWFAFEDSEEKFVIGALHHIKAVIETKEGNFDEAKESFDAAMELTDEIGMPFFKAQLIYTEGNLYHKMGNYSKAKDYYERAISIYRDQRCLVEIKRIKSDIKRLEEEQQKIAVA